MTTDRNALIQQHRDLDRELLAKMDRGEKISREEWDRLEALHQAIVRAA